jgi:hypothetical protein
MLADRMRMSAGGVFILPVIEGLKLHLDAFAIEGKNDNDVLSAWEDLSPSEFSLVAGGSPVYKTGVLKGKPVVRFNGSSRFLIASNDIFAAVGGATACGVFINKSVTSSNRNIFGSMTSTSGGVYRFNICNSRTNDGSVTVGGRRLNTNSYTVAQSGGGIITEDVAYSMIGTIDYQNTLAQVFVDGGIEAQNTSFLTSGVTTNSSGHAGIAYRPHDNDQYFIGDIAELVVYNRYLSSDERNEIEKYFKRKWL